MPSDGKAKVTHIERLPGDVSTLTLSALSEGFFGGAEPGAHLDAKLPDGGARQYSLYDWSEDGNTVMCIKMTESRMFMSQTGSRCSRETKRGGLHGCSEGKRRLPITSLDASQVTARIETIQRLGSRLAEPEVRMSCATEKTEEYSDSRQKDGPVP